MAPDLARTSPPARPGPARRAAAVLPAAIAAAVALTVSTLIPLAGPLLVALALGAIAGNTRLADLPVLAGQHVVTKLLLRLGVVLLGLRLPVADILEIGPGGIAVVVVTVVTTYAATVVMGDRLGLDKGFVTLLAAGFSICGAAAIAVVDDAVRARQRDVALAVAMVTLFGSAMILAVPWLAEILSLTEEQSAVWAGASIHEVAQVLAAASIIGSGALAVATTVKLGRVVLLAPVYAVAARRAERSGELTGAGRGPLVPWFVIGFVVAVAIRSTIPLSSGVLDVADTATTLLLAAGMFGLGMGIRAKEIWPVPARAVLLASASTCVAAGVSLLLVVVLTG